jgi:hypothetical protein
VARRGSLSDTARKESRWTAAQVGTVAFAVSTHRGQPHHQAASVHVVRTPLEESPLLQIACPASRQPQPRPKIAEAQPRTERPPTEVRTQSLVSPGQPPRRKAIHERGQL